MIAQEVVSAPPGSSQVWIALIGQLGIVATILITHLLSNRKQAEIVNKQDEVSHKQDDAAVEQVAQAGAIQEVHTLTNDRLERMDAALKAMRLEAEKDRAEIRSLKRLLATARREPKTRVKARVK